MATNDKNKNERLLQFQTSKIQYTPILIYSPFFQTQLQEQKQEQKKAGDGEINFALENQLINREAQTKSSSKRAADILLLELLV